MKFFAKSICLISTLFFCANCFAQDSTTDAQEEIPSSLSLSIADAVDYAIRGNLSVKEGSLTLEQKKRQVDYVWGSLIPTIRATASFKKTFDEQNSPADFSLGGSINLSLSPSIYTTVKSASLNYELQEMNYEKTVRNVELNVRKLYYSLLYEKENLVLIQNNVNTAQTQYNSNLTKYNYGRLSQLDVLSSQISLQKAQINLDVAKGNYESDLASFKQVLGIPQSTEVTLSGSLDDIENMGEVKIQGGMDSSSATVANYEKQLEIAQNSLLATRFSAWGPTVTAGYSYTAAGNTDSGLKSNNFGSLSLSVSIPLDGYLPWSSGAQSIQNQEDKIQTLEMELEDAKTTSGINVDGYLRKIKQNQDNIVLRKKSISLAEQTYNMTAQAYSKGTRDLLSLQNALSSLEQARLDLKNEILSLASNILELENALEVPFGTLTNTVAEESN